MWSLEAQDAPIVSLDFECRFPLSNNVVFTTMFFFVDVVKCVEFLINFYACHSFLRFFWWFSFLMQIVLKQIRQDNSPPSVNKPRGDSLMAQVCTWILILYFLEISFINVVEYNGALLSSRMAVNLYILLWLMCALCRFNT